MRYFIISAPSGCGKTTIIKNLLADHPNIRLSVSMTTRSKRASEVHGKDYYFGNDEMFQLLLEQDAFLEHTFVFGHYYGSPKSELKLLAGFQILFDVDVKGMRAIKSFLPDAQSIFIAPPSIQVLEQRLIGRGEDHPEIIAKRLVHAKDYLDFQSEYDYVILNDQLDVAIDMMSRIVS